MLKTKRLNTENPQIKIAHVQNELSYIDVNCTIYRPEKTAEKVTKN